MQARKGHDVLDRLSRIDCPTFVGAGLTLGYIDATMELPEADIYSLWSLTPKAGPGMQ